MDNYIKLDAAINNNHRILVYKQNNKHKSIQMYVTFTAKRTTFLAHVQIERLSNDLSHLEGDCSEVICKY
jgi:hypothetical protein